MDLRYFPLPLSLLLFLTLPITAWQAAASPVKPLVSSLRQNLESFELIWKTIRKTHWDRSLVGESWDRHRAELLPKISAAQSVSEARQIMAELIDRLGQSHFGIIPAGSYDVIDGIPGGRFNVGITVRLVEDQLVVSAVRPGSSAAKSGVKPGWAIKRIRERNSETLIAKFRSTAEGPQRSETTVTLAMPRWLSGSDGDRLPIEFVDGNNQSRAMNLAFETPPGRYSKFGQLPAVLVEDETRTLPGDIGYYRFSSFLDALNIMPNFQRAVRDEKHAQGLVIDVRGNIGGLAAMTMGMAGEFVSKPQTLGTLTMRNQTLNFIANPRPEPYRGAVAVLVDEGSISSAEIFAGGLQDLGLARIFGSRTAGLALPSIVIKLPNGDGFQYAIADYHSASGKSLERDGVLPDEEIKLTRQSLVQSADPVLAAALNWISGTDRN